MACRPIESCMLLDLKPRLFPRELPTLAIPPQSLLLQVNRHCTSGYCCACNGDVYDDGVTLRERDGTVAALRLLGDLRGDSQPGSCRALHRTRGIQDHLPLPSTGASEGAIGLRKAQMQQDSSLLGALPPLGHRGRHSLTHWKTCR